MFAIINNSTGLFWSNADGWVTKDTADRFSALERNTLRLPMGGLWVIA